MKKKRNIKTRILLTLSGTTTALLLIVGIAFNISVQGYIKSSVTDQLSTVNDKAFSERYGEKEDQKGQDQVHPDGKKNRLAGSLNGAIVIPHDGSSYVSIRGDEEEGAVVAEYFMEHTPSTDIINRVITISSSKYAVTVSDDPMQKSSYLVSYVNVTSIYDFASRVNLVLLIIILAAILLSVILSRIFARSFAEPVNELSSFAAKIGGGDLAPQEFHFNDTEFTALGDSMNKMAGELYEAKQKQEVFFQNVSHELRTPLTSIKGNAEGIVYGVMEPAGAAKIILSESEKLSGMVEDILYLSRVGKAAPESEAASIDLRDVLSLCVSEQHLGAEEKGISFEYDFDDTPVMLNIREQDAGRMLGNLISNAIRYAKSKIILVCHASGDQVTVSVKDDGDGIEPADLPYVFERFYKGKGGKHGIGLAITKAVADAYCGSISARNEGGAVFEITFKK